MIAGDFGIGGRLVFKNEFAGGISDFAGGFIARGHP